MTQETYNYESLASLLEYPSQVAPNFFSGWTLEDLQELYTKTFDMNPGCSLYASVHLFGEESFKRAELMAKLNEEYIKYNFNSKNELPDFIPTILKFVTHLKDEKKYIDLLSLCVVKPLKLILDKIDNNNPYRALVNYIKLVVEKNLEEKTVHV